MTDTYLVDYKLGLDKLDDPYSPEEFWAHVRDHLLALPSASARPITHLQLAGDAVTNDKFFEVLKEALTELGGPVKVSQLNITAIINPIFAAARGAATLAQRRQVAPWGCVEAKKCEEERRRQRETADGIKVEL
jgi:hypothetical protein